MGKFKDLTGMRFGKWTVLKYIGKGKYLCMCECGTVKEVNRSHLMAGASQSCGCSRGEKHGQTNSRLYGIWRGIKTRCYNTNHKDYKLYGHRGIKVCNEWLNSFKTFQEWSVTHGYSDDLTIDRIDSDGDYRPDNCRWVNIKIQSNNTSRNHNITYKGVTHTMAEWSVITNIPYTTLKYRVRAGWRIEDIFIKKCNKHK